MINDIVKEFRSGDMQTIFTQTKNQLTMPMRETAVLFAMRIALADGRIDDERKALLVLGQQFEIPENKFAVMVDVIMMLQRAPEST